MTHPSAHSIPATILISLAAVIFFALGVRELIHERSTLNVSHYVNDKIPLTYPDLATFTDFLKKNNNRIIAINAELIFDASTKYNLQVHEACNYAPLLDILLVEPEKLDGMLIGLATHSLSNDLVTKTNPRTLSPTQSVEHINLTCIDKLRFINLETKALAFKFGGTGMISLPIAGQFSVNIKVRNNQTLFTLTQI